MTPEEYKIIVGRRLRLSIEDIMRRKHITQSEVARSAGISPQRLSNYLRGDNYPDPFALFLLCRRWGLTLDWIYRGVISGLPEEFGDLFRVGAIESPEEQPEEARRTRRKA